MTTPDDPGAVSALVEALDDESLYAGDPFPLYARLREKAAGSYCIPGSRRTRAAVATL
jgi:hypothetical protein